MLIGNNVYLRLFETNDFEKTYIWHNDAELQKWTCGNIRIVSKEIEREWVHSKCINNTNELYLAICVNETNEMIGWYSITDIDYLNRKCHCSGVLIGDKRYRDGEAYVEAGDLAFNYIINEMNMNRISGSCLKEHVLSRAQMEATYWTLEGIERQTIYKNGKYHDICHYSILKDEFLTHLHNGDYNHHIIIKRLRDVIKKLKNDNNQLIKNSSL